MFDIIDGGETTQHSESLEFTESPFFSSANVSNLPDYDSPLESILSFSSSIGMMDAAVTANGSIITTWTQSTTLGGYIPPSIRIYSLPSEGSSDALSLDLLDLQLERVVLLPNNISSFRECRSHLLSNGSIMMVCADSDPGSSGFRIDIGNQSMEIPEFYGGVFVWNATNDFQSMWSYERPSTYCRGGIKRAVFGEAGFVPVHFVNDTFIAYLNCLNNQVTTIGNSNLSCPNNFIGCSAVAQFDMFGNVSNITYMQYAYSGTSGNGPYPCQVNGLDVTPHGFVEIFTYNYCKFYNSSGTYLHTTANGGNYEWVVLDSNSNLCEFPDKIRVAK